MAYRPAEVWINEDNTIVATRAKNGKWNYFISSSVRSRYSGILRTTEWAALEDSPVVAREISELNLEIAEAIADQANNSV